MIHLENNKALINEIAITPEGRLYMAILVQAINDVVSGYGFYDRKVALDWFLLDKNPMRDLCLMIADIDNDYILKTIKDKIGMTEYEEIARGYK
jgi:hypothetical protein